jgi:hypothetical protein
MLVGVCVSVCVVCGVVVLFDVDVSVHVCVDVWIAL